MAKALRPEPLSSCLQDNRRRLLAEFKHLADVRARDLLLPVAGGRPRPALLLYIDAMVDVGRLEQGLLAPLLRHGAATPGGDNSSPPLSLPVQARAATHVAEVVAGVLRGEAALLLDGAGAAQLLAVRQVPARPPEEPQVEVSVHGGREALTSLLETNLGLLRRRLPTTALRIERRTMGTLTHTRVALIYVAGRANPELVKQLRRRLAQVNPPAIIDTEDLITAVVDQPNSVMPTVHITERPDTLARHLVAGRVAIIADNSPRALLLPALLMDLLAAVDDFYERRLFAALVRAVRMLALLASIFLPALYISVLTFHLQSLPTLLTLSLLAQREGAPLPTPVEAFAMVMTFEVLREAGLRLPRPVGPGVSIVGGLVIGEAAMRAGVTSPAMVLVVSATAVSTFAIPSPTLANVATMLRLGMLVLSSLFGFFGVLIGYVLLLAHLAGLSSGRAPFAAPYMPLQLRYLPEAYSARRRPPEGPGSSIDPKAVYPPGQQKRSEP